MHSGLLLLLFIICQRNKYTEQRPVCGLFQAVHGSSNSHPWAGLVKWKTEWRQMDGWYLFNSLNIELGCTGASSDVIWKKRQNILALCHLFINIINLYYLRNYSKYTRRLRRRHESWLIFLRWDKEKTAKWLIWRREKRASDKARKVHSKRTQKAWQTGNCILKINRS